jgi:hypothetical protein
MSVNGLRFGSARSLALAVGFIAFSSFIGAHAEAIKVEGSLSTKEEIKLEFKDGTNHLFTLVRREGTLEGTGAFAKATVQEYGVHDVVPGYSGAPSGYLVITKSEKDVAYLKWSTQTSFIKGNDGKSYVANNGTWTFISGLGSFANLKGTGKIKITFGKDNQRVFALEGNLGK